MRAYNILRRMAKHHDVWLATILWSADDAEGVPHMQQYCRDVISAELQRRHPLAHLPGLISFASTGKPLELKFYFSKELGQKIRTLASEIDFDVVQVEESLMAPYLEVLPRKVRARRVLTFYDIVSDQAKRNARVLNGFVARGRAWLDSLMMRRWEAKYAERFDRCITVSERDRQLLLAANPRLQVEVVPNGVDTEGLQPLARQDDGPNLLLVGSLDYAPGADGAIWLVKEILPHIKRSIPDMETWIVGRDPPPDVLRLDGDGVHVTGTVKDVCPYYGHSSVCVVPIRAGGGTRLKVLEAMALGRPVVSTTVGCEGLDVVDGEHLLIADTPAEFATQTERLIRDQALWKRITTQARQLVVSHYDWGPIAEDTMRIYAEVGALA